MHLVTWILTGALLLFACAAPTGPPAQNEGNAHSVTGEEEDFRLDHVLHSDRHADIHFNLYIPEDYDGSGTCPHTGTHPFRRPRGGWRPVSLNLNEGKEG